MEELEYLIQQLDEHGKEQYRHSGDTFRRYNSILEDFVKALKDKGFISK